MIKWFNAYFIKYLMVSIVNTLSSYAVYLFLLKFYSYRKSYVVGFIVGLIISISLNKIFVFKANNGIKPMGYSAVIILVQFSACFYTAKLWVEDFNGDKIFAPLVALIVFYPMAFALNKIVFTGKFH